MAAPRTRAPGDDDGAQPGQARPCLCVSLDVSLQAPGLGRGPSWFTDRTLSHSGCWGWKCPPKSHVREVQGDSLEMPLWGGVGVA